MARVLIQMPSSARRGEVIELRVTIAHPMETGYRPGADGQPLPRNVLNHFSCHYNGELVIHAELYPSIAANPHLAFHTMATDSGTLTFEWRGEHGFAHVERRELRVT